MAERKNAIQKERMKKIKRKKHEGKACNDKERKIEKKQRGKAAFKYSPDGKNLFKDKVVW